MSSASDQTTPITTLMKIMIPFISAKRRLKRRNKKCIAKWAENKETVNKLLMYQNKTIVPEQIFGKLSVDTVNLAEVFGPVCKADFRGSSANWKNENWTPVPTPDSRFSRQILQNGCAENLEKKFAESQDCCTTLNEELSEDESDEVAGSSYDFLRLQLPPSWQENKE